MPRRRFTILLLIAPILGFLLAIMFYPLALMAYRSVTDPAFGFDHYVRIVDNEVYAQVMWTTLYVSGLVTLACLLIGYPLAYAAATRGPRLRLALMASVMIPFATSLLVRTYAWMILLGAEGPVAQAYVLFGLEPPQMLYNRFGAVIGMVYVMVPFMVLTLYGVMSEIDGTYQRAARSLGASPLRAFLHVYLPQSLPGVTGGILLVFVVSIGFFVTPALLGGRREIFIAELIQTNVQQIANWGFASALAVTLLALTMILLVVYDRVLGRESVFATGGSGAR